MHAFLLILIVMLTIVLGWMSLPVLGCMYEQHADFGTCRLIVDLERGAKR